MRNPPTSIKLHREERVLEIQWDSEATHRLGAYELRCDCQCAACVDENTGKRILDIAAVPHDIGVTGAKLVGAYSIRLDFSDGHSTGLFTWDHLHKLANAHS